jgi:dCTP deaminase
MVLSDRDIRVAMRRGDIVVEPFHERFLQAASVDLHLDRHFLVFDSARFDVIDPKKPMEDLMVPITVNGDDAFVLQPGHFALGLIYEKTGVGNSHVARLEGKSSVGRFGVTAHITAGFLDPGNLLKMTLELHNTAPLPVRLYPGMPIAQMAFEELSSPCERPYGHIAVSKYTGDVLPVASKMHLNFSNGMALDLAAENRISLQRG